MISVRVQVRGALEKPLNDHTFALELDDGSTLEDLLLKAGYRPEHLRLILPAVNGIQQRLTCRLAHGDGVILCMPVGGG